MTKKTKDTKQDKPVAGFDDLVKALLSTPPSPKPDSGNKDVRKKSKKENRSNR